MKWKMMEPQNVPAVRLVQAMLANPEPFPLPLAQLLVARGFTQLDQMKAFFKPDRSQLHDPMLMKDMDRAVTRFVEAVEKGQRIMVYGDYDVDGTTAVSLMALVLEDWGLDFITYIPDRYLEGYGLSVKGVETASENGVSLLITLDCGTKAIDQIQLAKEKGIDVIVCDHHRPGKNLPPLVALLNPKQEGCEYPYKELTGCALGYKFLTAVAEILPDAVPETAFPPDYDIISRYGDLIALSLACDIVELAGENRTLVHFGLEKLRKNPLPGLAALMNLAKYERTWTVSDLVFFIGPRINAAGRLTSGEKAVELLTAKSQNLIDAADFLQRSNEQRQMLEAEITEEALEMIRKEHGKAASTVLWDENWHKGVIGIVASRLTETYYRPTILLTKSEGKWVGSARSVRDFDLYAALQECEAHILQFGGHKYAAGLTLAESQLEEFRRKFESVVAAGISDDQKEEWLHIAAEIDFSYIDSRFIRLIKRFAPFGPGNRQPNFVARDVEVLDSTILKETHIRLQLAQKGRKFEAIGFGQAEKWQRVPGNRIDIAFQPDFKTWQGKSYIQLRVKDLKLPAKVKE